MIVLRSTATIKQVSFVVEYLKMAPKGRNMYGHINIVLFIVKLFILDSLSFQRHNQICAKSGLLINCK
jgi:hypothetical protein